MGPARALLGHDAPMRLLLMRHGVAEDAGPATGNRDEPRALTDEGRSRIQAASRGLQRLSPGVEVIISSPLTRCRQTAEIVGEALGLPVHQEPRLAPGAELDDVAEALLSYPDAGCVLVCGHQPDMSGIVAELTGGLVEFRKGTLAVMEADALRAHGGYLRALYPPASLGAMAPPG